MFRSEIVEVTPAMRERMMKSAHSCIEIIQQLPNIERFLVLEMLWTSLEATIGVQLHQLQHFHITKNTPPPSGNDGGTIH